MTHYSINIYIVVVRHEKLADIFLINNNLINFEPLKGRRRSYILLERRLFSHFD